MLKGDCKSQIKSIAAEAAPEMPQPHTKEYTP